MLSEVAQVLPYNWATFEGKFVTKNFKNRPIWSHLSWATTSKSTKSFEWKLLNANRTFFLIWNQCDQIWRNLTTRQKLIFLANSWVHIRYLAKLWTYLLWQIFYTFGQIFIGSSKWPNIEQKNLAIWSHCSLLSTF